MGWLSSFFDDVVGLDPNGGGIYGAFRDVLPGNTADDWLGMDPNGGGFIGGYNTLGPMTASWALGDWTTEWLKGLGGPAGGGLSSAANTYGSITPGATGGLSATSAGTAGLGQGAGLSSMFPSIGGSAAAGGSYAALTGGDVGKGILQGGLAGGISGLDAAGSMGIDNPIARSAVNKGIGGGTASLASGNSLEDATKTGLTNAAGAGVASGLNQVGGKMGDYFSNVYNSIFGDGAQPLSPNPAQNASYSADWQPPGQDLYNTMTGQESPAMSYAPPSSGSFLPVGGSAGYFPAARSPSNVAPNQSQQKSKAGLGDLAATLYGAYNNLQQQKMARSSINGLQELYSGNGAYAQQLRKKLQAQAGKAGTRSNTAGRETQLMASLADRSAQLAPSLYQMQGGLGKLQSNLLDQGVMGWKNLGGAQGLQDMFKDFTPPWGG